MGTPGGDLLRDLLECQLPERKVAEDQSQRQERGRERPRDDDLGLPELVAWNGLPRDDDRAVPRADARSMREECVVLLDERVRGQRDRRHFEPCRPRPLVQGLDVREHLLELEPLVVDEIRRQRPEHERVVGIRAVAEPDPHEAGHASTVISALDSTTRRGAEVAGAACGLSG